MKKIGASLFFAGVLTSAFAQTNLPATRPLSLQDCFAAALKNNFDVRIEQYNPQISQFSLSAAYGGYDPTFTLGGQHQYSDTGANVDSLGNIVLPTEDRANTFTSGLNGLTPWGMTYDFNGNVSQQHVTKSLFNTNF